MFSDKRNKIDKKKIGKIPKTLLIGPAHVRMIPKLINERYYA